MIVCTGCGARNADDARVCQNCGRKLQSQWAVPGKPADAGRADADRVDADRVDAGRATPDAWSGPGRRIASGLGGEPLDLDALGGGPLPRDSGMEGGAWERIAPVEHKLDPRASHMVRRCAETWLYGLGLIAAAVTTCVAEDWRYLAGAIAVVAGLALVRGL
ncbi:MAG: hypothetical protein AUJ49_01905 [Desulfovibrionaceae bacterium CG1_02_65_16]|nr:MAG: hypothetical protein AUJ49_01905 [Desulfovibrionaceae bacterium CG1_02_65_16]